MALDEVQCFVLAPTCLLAGPDLGPNCLQRLSADNKSRMKWRTGCIAQILIRIVSMQYTYSQFCVWYTSIIFERMH